LLSQVVAVVAVVVVVAQAVSAQERVML